MRSGARWLRCAKCRTTCRSRAPRSSAASASCATSRGKLATARLLTLVGMGGLGETRLSLQVAAEAMAEFPDGVWFLDLAPIRDPAYVTGEAAGAGRARGGRPAVARNPLRPPEAAPRPAGVRQLRAPARGQRRAGARGAEGSAHGADDRLAGSAAGAGRKGLPNPAAAGAARTASPRSCSARPPSSCSSSARSAQAGVRAHRREAPAVAELVAQLEGIPLALELAAARVRSLSVADINARLKDRYKILTGGSRVLQERQQTLRALVDWCYELLTETEQLMLRRLAVFVGGFDLEAAEKVCGAEPIEAST